MYFIPKYRRGILNKYRKGMPISEMLLKDIIFAWQWAGNFFARSFKPITILCIPHFPSRRSAIYKLCRYMHYNITNKPSRNFDLAIYYDYSTYRNEFHHLDKIAKEKKTLNYYSRDISKENVDKNFKEVFGYSTFVDPLTHKGYCVKKSDINAMHDGKVIECPVHDVEDGYVYQIALDNLAENGMHEDIRIPIVAGEIPMVFLQYRTQDNRFSTAKKGVLKATEEALSQWEIQKIKELAKKMHIDFGEMDTIRHKQDNKLYVIDVNDTPSTRERLFTKKEFDPFLKTQGKIFEKAFIQKKPHQERGGL